MSDIFSLGLFLHYYVKGYHPFENISKDERPEIKGVSCHPFLWSNEKFFNFLANLSDIIEKNPKMAKDIERNKTRIFISLWNTLLDPIIQIC